MATSTTTLWRPVGRNELALIESSGYREFPPRLAQQPIFYPVLNFAYAERIARDWNSTDARHDNLGFVTRFDVASDFLAGDRCEESVAVVDRLPRGPLRRRDCLRRIREVSVSWLR